MGPPRRGRCGSCFAATGPRGHVQLTQSGEAHGSKPLDDRHSDSRFHCVVILLRGKLLLACWLNMLHLIHRLAEPRELPVHLSPGPVRVSQRLMLWQAVPRVVAEDICECEL